MLEILAFFWGKINIHYIFFSIILIWNTIVFIIYTLDKQKSKKNKYRISEKFLLVCALLMGAGGALMGMYMMRHKTNHKKFVILVPLFFILNCFTIFLYIKIQIL